MIEEIYYASGTDEKKMGRAKISWQDNTSSDQRGKDWVLLTFPCFSNPVITIRTQEGSDGAPPKTKDVVGAAYGDLMLPDVGDLVVIGFVDQSTAIVIGYFPRNYAKQTIDNAAANDNSLEAKARRGLAGLPTAVQQGVGVSQKNIVGFDTLRRIVPGEFSRTSKQKTEIYQDRVGGVHIIAKAQLSKSVAKPKQDGSEVSNVDDIDVTKVPTAVIARVTVGEIYTDENFTTRDTNSKGNKMVLRVSTPKGVKISIDTEGNIEFNSGDHEVDITGNFVRIEAGFIKASCKNGDAQVTISDAGVNIEAGNKGHGAITLGNGSPVHPVVFTTNLGPDIMDVEDLQASTTVWVGE